jgi:hypothetical protein
MRASALTLDHTLGLQFKIELAFSPKQGRLTQSCSFPATD